MKTRRLISMHKAPRHDVAHLYTRMPFSIGNAVTLDPFLLLAHHGPQTFPPDNDGLPFDAHPHRGFETITLIIEGELLHRDSGGHENVVSAGGVQWMTAGAGVIHEELATDRFHDVGGNIEILQLWMNLPATLKMTPARYTGVEADQLSSVALSDDGSVAQIVSGDFLGTRGPIDSLTDAVLATISLKAGASASLPAPGGRTVLFYTVRGEIVVGQLAIPPGHLVLFDTTGEGVELTARGDALILFGHAEPIGEPVVAHGPFIMNTQDEIRQAYADYREGRFATHTA